jgi:hypothetical protein
VTRDFAMPSVADVPRRMGDALSPRESSLSRNVSFVPLAETLPSTKSVRFSSQSRSSLEALSGTLGQDQKVTDDHSDCFVLPQSSKRG